MTGCGGRSGRFEWLAASSASKHGHVNPALGAPTHRPHQLKGEDLVLRRESDRFLRRRCRPVVVHL